MKTKKLILILSILLVFTLSINTTFVSATIVEITPSQDLTLFDIAGSNRKEAESYMKFDISGVPAGKTITAVYLQLYVTTNTLVDTDADFYNVNNQAWTEATAVATLDGYTRSNQVNQAAGWTGTGYINSTDIKAIFNVDYGTNTYCSVFMMDPDEPSNPDTSLDDTYMYIGDNNANTELVFDSRTGTNAPVLYVVYEDADNDEPEVQNWTFELNASVYDGDTYNKYNYWPSGSLVRMNITVTDANTVSGVNFTITDMKNPGAPINYTAKNDVGDEWFNISDCSASGNFTVNWTAGIDDKGNENQTGIEINGSHYWICDIDIPIVDNMSVNETSVLTGDIVCINASITDLWGIPDRMFAEVSYTNGTVRNESMTDDGTHPSCDDAADDGWYGVLVNVSDVGGTFAFNFTFGNDTADNRYSKEDTTQTVTVTVPDYDAPNVRNYTFELNASVYDGDTYNKYNYWPSGSLVRMNITVDDDANSVSGVNFTITDMKNPGAPVNYTAKNDVADEWYNISDCLASGNFTINWTAGIDDKGNENQTGIEINGSHYWICDLDTPTVNDMDANESIVTSNNETICINASVSDAWGIIDEVLATVTFPNDTVRNETLTDTGGGANCGTDADDGWYGIELIVGDTLGTFTFNFSYTNDTAGNLGSEITTPQTIDIEDRDTPEVRNWTFELNASVFDGDTYNKYNYWPSGSLIRMNMTVNDYYTVAGANFTVTDVKNSPDTPSNYTGKNDDGEEVYNISDCSASGNFSVTWVAGIDESGNENQTGIEINGSHYWICDLDTPTVDNMSANETSVLTGDIVCINASITDAWGIPDRMFAEVSYTNGTVRNESMTDDGTHPSCDDTADDGWYGVLVNVSDSAGTFAYNFTFGNDTADNRYSKEDTTQTVTVTVPADTDEPEVQNWTFELNASVYDGNTYNKYNYWPSGSLVRMNVTVTDANTVSGVNFTITDVKNPGAPVNYTGKNDVADEWFNISDCSASGNFTVNWTAGIDDSGNENQTGIEINGSHYWICDVDIPVIDNMSANETSVLTGDIVCINASITDAWGIPDRMFAEVSYTNGTVRNESMADDGTHPSCDDTADDGWYGVLVNVSDSAGTFAYNFTFGNDTADNRYSKEDTTQTVTVTVPDYDAPNVRNYTFELNASVYDGDTYNKYNYWPSGSLVRMNITVDDDAGTVAGVNFTITDMKNPSAPINYTGKNDVADEWFNISDCSASGNFTINYTAGIDDLGNENQTGIEINGSHYWICDVDTPTIGNMSSNSTDAYTYNTICINASITDAWGLTDEVQGTVTYPNGTFRNETMTDTAASPSCDDVADDGWFGLLLYTGDTEGNITFNFSYTNDTAGNAYRNESVDAEVNISITTEPDIPPIINWIAPTPADAATVNGDSVTLNTTVSDSQDTSAFFDWNYTLAGYWSMDYYDDGGVQDNSSYGSYGDFINGSSTANITEGRFGEALNVSGGECLRVNDSENANLNITGNLTIEFWIFDPPVGYG